MPHQNPIQSIEANQRILRDLRRILRQPGALDLVQLIFREHHVGENGTQPLPSKDRTLEKRGAVLPTGITEAVWNAASALVGDFTSRQILELLAQQSYSVVAKNPEKAIGEALRRLKDQKKLTLVRTGSGGKQSVFRVSAGVS